MCAIVPNSSEPYKQTGNIYIWNWWYIYTYKRLYAIKIFFLLAPPQKKFVFRREKERGINQLDGENLQIIEYHVYTSA